MKMSFTWKSEMTTYMHLLWSGSSAVLSRLRPNWMLSCVRGWNISAPTHRACTPSVSEIHRQDNVLKTPLKTERSARSDGGSVWTGLAELDFYALLNFRLSTYMCTNLWILHFMSGLCHIMDTNAVLAKSSNCAFLYPGCSWRKYTVRTR